MAMVTAMEATTEAIMESEQHVHSSEIRERESINLADLINDMWKGLVRNWWLYVTIISITASITYFGSLKRYVLS